MTTPEPLSIRMLQAAKILEEFNTVYSDIYNLDAGWRPSELRREAEHCKTEEQEAADAKSAACPGFAYVGQPWSSCDRCAQPYWEHTHMEHPAKGSGPFDDVWEYEPISEQSKEATRRRWIGAA